jgi:hypothetical protein
MSLNSIQHNHPPFSQEHPGILFYTTANQSLISSLVIQPVSEHLVVIPLGKAYGASGLKGLEPIILFF